MHDNRLLSEGILEFRHRSDFLPRLEDAVDFCRVLLPVSLNRASDKLPERDPVISKAELEFPFVGFPLMRYFRDVDLRPDPLEILAQLFVWNALKLRPEHILKHIEVEL